MERFSYKSPLFIIVIIMGWGFDLREALGKSLSLPLEFCYFFLLISNYGVFNSDTSSTFPITQSHDWIKKEDYNN